MLLESRAHYNNLSTKLREELLDRVKSFGKTVRYKFDISNVNPEPTKHDGPIIWPNMYTLDPTIFTINDPYEEKGKGRSKLIGLIAGIDEKGMPNRFHKIRVAGRMRGVLRLDIEENETDLAYCMFLELHPKLSGGLFADKTKKQLIQRIDEQAAAKEQRDLRKARKLALDAAESMSDSEVYEFADGMGYEKLDISLLRNQIEALAESDPNLFNDLIADKKVKYRATIKRAIESNVLLHDPADGKLMLGSTQQVICMLGMGTGEKTDIERFAQWFLTSGDKADAMYKKIQSLLKAKPETV